MNQRIEHKAIMSLGTLGAALFGSLISACSIPSPNCTAAFGNYAVKLVKKTGEGTCAELPGAIVGSRSYVAEKGGQPQLDKVFAAFKAKRMGDHLERAEDQAIDLDPDPDHKTYSFGAFSTEKPNSSDICAIPTMSEALQALPLVPAVADDPMTEEDESLPELPATTMSYKWSNIRMRLTPDELGASFVADLEFSQDDCVATYEAVGVFPPVSCTGDAECKEDGNGLIDSYRERATCDTNFGYCVLPGI